METDTQWNLWMLRNRSIRRLRGSFICLGIAGAFLAVQSDVAQAQKVADYRLSVRPHEMETGTRTERAGWFPVGAMRVYVPKQCVGSRRCPLLLITNTPDEFGVRIADDYGMIVAQKYKMTIEVVSTYTADLDRDIKAILRVFAIDPAKIAIIGRCMTGLLTNDYGNANLDVFSRIVVFTQHIGDPPVRAPNRSNEYYIAGGIGEDNGAGNFQGARRLRDRGYPVKHTLQFRGHVWQQEDYNFMAQWLQESWAIPNPKARPAPPVFGNPPLLTTEIIAQMAAFWTRFVKEPDSIKTTARMTHVREVVLSLGNDRISTLMMDMPALAAKYSSVAAALTTAGLTPQQHDVYRAALAGAYIVSGQKQQRDGTRDSIVKGGWDYSPGFELGTLKVAATSALAKNAQFLEAHPHEFKALGQTAIWNTP